MSVDVVFRVKVDVLEELIRDLSNYPELEPKIIQTAGAAGGGDLVTILIGLSASTLTAVTTIATAWIRRPRQIATVEISGRKIIGISQSVADEIALKLAEAELQGAIEGKGKKK